MSDEAPRRLLEDLPEDAGLRRALDAAQRDLPSTARVEAMLARMPLPPSGGGAGSGGAPEPLPALPKHAAPLGLKLAGGAVAVALVGGALWRGLGPAPAPAPPATATAATSSGAAPPPTASATTPEPRASEPASSALSTAPERRPPNPTSAPGASASATEPEPRSETAILREARAKLSGDPAGALALCEEHARAHPRGSLGQEREMVRVEALVALGRRAEAQAIADAFKKQNPGSAYARRLDAILGR